MSAYRPLIRAALSDNTCCSVIIKYMEGVRGKFGRLTISVVRLQSKKRKHFDGAEALASAHGPLSSSRQAHEVL